MTKTIKGNLIIEKDTTFEEELIKEKVNAYHIGLNSKRDKTLKEIKAGIEELDLKRIIDDWYYNEINQAVTIGDISRIELAKKIREELQKIFKEIFEK